MAKLPPFAGKSVSQVMALCGAAYEHLVLIDDPPGRLRMIELDCTPAFGGGRIVLDVSGETPLFAADRIWPANEVMALQVRRVLGSSEEAF